ncbi:MAG: hypothetical protein K2X27_12710 [Candidatus Obscuribacterales bacterium]|nr:hypothetical protein [Candidatus Obscuribacterales bacterium]
MAETTNEAELGRGKHAATPKEHLYHLLNIGWKPNSPLIQKFVIENGLQRDLDAWTKEQQRYL